MRNMFAKVLTEIAKDDSRITLLSGDIGNRLFDAYKEVAEERFFNCGVAEANMIGVAAGLALSGFKPVTYTITPFMTVRCMEQIRLDVCYHNLPVVIVGTGSGLSYAELGPTHHSLEDIGLLRNFPNLSIVAPADATEVRLALKAALELDTPVYIRLGKKNEPAVHEGEPVFEIGKAIELITGKKVMLLGGGSVTSVCMDTSKILKERGISTGVASFHTVKPLDEAMLEKAFSEYDLVVTVEEHGLINGLGAAVAGWAVDGGKPTGKLFRIGTPDEFLEIIMNQAEAREHFGLTPGEIAKSVEIRLNG